MARYVEPSIALVARKHSRALQRAAIITAIVGTLIVMINHGDHLLQEPFCPHFFLKAVLSYVTPFVVSLVTSMLAAREAITAASLEQRDRSRLRPTPAIDSAADGRRTEERGR